MGLEAYEAGTTPTGPVSRLLSELKLAVFCAFYLGVNFTPIFILLWLYLAWHGSLACRAALVLTLLDYAVPLKAGHAAQWFWWCKLTNFAAGCRCYFPMELAFEGEWKRDKNYLLVYHPHSLFGVGFTLLSRYVHDLYGTTCLITVADVIRHVPLLRRIMAWWGCTSVSAPAMRRDLRLPWPHNALMLQPGGIAEMFYGVDREQIILRKRVGFCKVALQTGACLVPVYVLGAQQAWTRHFGPASLFARLSSALRVSLVVWSGRWGLPFGVVPHRQRMVVCCGAPIEVERVEQPTAAQVEALHARYVGELRALYARHKHRMGAEWAAERPELLLEDEVPAARAADKKRD